MRLYNFYIIWIKYFDEGFSVKDAMEKAMEITRGEQRETAFYFDADNLDSDEKVVQRYC